MTNIPDIIENVKNGVVKVTFYDAGDPLNSGSGFLCKNKLISNNHVFFPNGQKLDSTSVGIRFGDTLPGDEDPILINYEDLIKCNEGGSQEDYYDFIIIDLIKAVEDTVDKKLTIDIGNIEDRFNFELADHTDVQEGEKILIMGFPFGANNITSHIGYISSIFKDDTANIIQLDASTNNGNSGGPVIDLNTKNVIGIITRKKTGLAKSFDDLEKSFDKNLEALSLVNGTMTIGGNIDLIQSFKATQVQMKIVSKNIKRSANTGIGFAFSCDKLKQENFYLGRSN